MTKEKSTKTQIKPDYFIQPEPEKKSRKRPEYMLYSYSAIRIADAIYDRWNIVDEETYKNFSDSLKSAFLKLGGEVPEHIYNKFPPEIREKFAVKK